jgi:HSP20 family protein
MEVAMVRGLVPWSGLPQPFDTLRREMDTLFDRYLGWDGGRSMTMFEPPADVAETEDAYEVTVELPGLKADDFNVEIKEGDLWITGQKRDEREEKGWNYHRVERHYGEFRRVIPLATPVDAEKVEAHYKDGVLSIQVPKWETAKPRRINVKA